MLELTLCRKPEETLAMLFKVKWTEGTAQVVTGFMNMQEQVL